VVLKGVNFMGLREVGDPVEMAVAYEEEGADEIAILDITATPEDRGTFVEAVRRVAEAVTIPVLVGGGVKTLRDAEALFKAGADKVSINTAAVKNPGLIREMAEIFPLGGPHGLAYAVFHLGVDAVAGPGGLYVQAAKYVLSQYVGIDGIEGPTELVVYAEGVDAETAMRGALAQLEHGPTSFAHFITPDPQLLRRAEEIYAREKTSSMGPLKTHLAAGVEEAVKLIDEIAPEHLEVWGRREVAYRVRNVGAVSVNMPSPYLDYAAGISHVLPTGGSARWRGIITPHTFMKPIGMAEAVGPLQLLDAARKLAEYEGFPYHRKALQ